MMTLKVLERLYNRSNNSATASYFSFPLPQLIKSQGYFLDADKKYLSVASLSGRLSGRTCLHPVLKRRAPLQKICLWPQLFREKATWLTVEHRH